MGLRPLELASAQPTPAELESPPRLHAHGPFGRTPERCHRHEASGPGAGPQRLVVVLSQLLQMAQYPLVSSNVEIPS
jgi:hypothetical protein